MGTSLLLIAVATTQAVAAPIPQHAVKKQETVFTQWWGTEFEWQFDELPTKGKVPKERIPYSGYIYPDTAGGTARVLRKYDYAFNRGRQSATSWENWDTNAYKEPRRGLFGFLGGGRTPYWHGHCNGWTAAAMRHAEPEKSVTRNGVTFSPSDIKALLAEIYIYNDTELLAGINSRLNAGTFHAILANWLGRGSHPIAMEADPSEEKWNYPIYSFATSHAKRGSREVEVKCNILYAKDTEDGEYNESPRNNRVKYFHYMLQLDGEGRIRGGYFFRDSAVIDFVWVPLQPKQAGRPGNERGNPHVRIKEVLAIWRDSVPEDKRNTWLNIDPVEEDRIVIVQEPEALVPESIENARPAVPVETEVPVAVNAREMPADEPTTTAEPTEPADEPVPTTPADEPAPTTEPTPAVESTEPTTEPTPATEAPAIPSLEGPAATEPAPQPPAPAVEAPAPVVEAPVVEAPVVEADADDMPQPPAPATETTEEDPAATDEPEVVDVPVVEAPVVTPEEAAADDPMPPAPAQPEATDDEVVEETGSDTEPADVPVEEGDDSNPLTPPAPVEAVEDDTLVDDSESPEVVEVFED